MSRLRRVLLLLLFLLALILLLVVVWGIIRSPAGKSFNETLSALGGIVTLGGIFPILLKLWKAINSYFEREVGGQVRANAVADFGRLYYTGVSLADPFMLAARGPRPEQRAAVAQAGLPSGTVRAAVNRPVAIALNVAISLIIPLGAMFAVLGILSVFGQTLTGARLISAFLGLLCVFGFIGALIGWAKTLLVIFSQFLALSVLTLLKDISAFRAFLEALGPAWSLIANGFIVLLLATLAYRFASSLPGLPPARHLQDATLGFTLGFFSGYLIVGSLLYFLRQFDLQGADATVKSLLLLQYLPQEVFGFGTPLIHIALVVSLIFLLVVFI